MALQTKHALSQRRDRKAKREREGHVQAASKATCKECENPSAPSEPWRSSLTKQHPLNESIRKHWTFLTKARRNGVLYLATSRRTRVAKVSRSKTPRRVGNERHTKVSDVSPVSPGNDHHTAVHKERKKHRAGNLVKTQRSTANIPG